MRLIQRDVYLSEIENWNYLQRLSHNLAEFYLMDISFKELHKNPIDFCLRDLLNIISFLSFLVFSYFMTFIIPVLSLFKTRPTGFYCEEFNDKATYVCNIWVLELED